MKIINSIILKLIPTLLFLGAFVQIPVQAGYDVSLYNVEWNSPGKDFTDSMPIGNGDIGLNVWVEPNGDLLFLIGKTDAFDENSTLLKLGRIRVRFTPNPFSNDTFFRQTLHLDRSEITIDQGGWLSIRIWVDANYPVIRVETNSEQYFTRRLCWKPGGIVFIQWMKLRLVICSKICPAMIHIPHMSFRTGTKRQTPLCCGIITIINRIMTAMRLT
jgi:hypothetical protein